MNDNFNDFKNLEHTGWERVAGKYDEAWTSLTTQFADSLLTAAGVKPGMRVLDVACGPGNVAAAAHRLGAIPVGVDFSRNMILRARQNHPEIEFFEGDAERLEFASENFDGVVMNFGVLHLANPETAFAEAQRVLRRGGRFGFTIWAKPEENPGARIMAEAIEAHPKMAVNSIPEGPPYNRFSDADECWRTLQASGFSVLSMTFDTVRVNWKVPTTRFLFDAELNAGVRTTAVLARYSLEELTAIRSAVEKSVERFASNGEYAIPMTANVISVAKE
jgi:ubiquinone/menaquinone biosynthesis C-methylase UbiE